MPVPEIKLTDPRALRGYAHPLRMALVGLLRTEGPMTATQAAEQLGESVPSCSFHLRQLAKYGLAERVEGADARERPWQATARVTSWDSGSDDPAVQAATDQLNTTILDHYLRRAQAYLARRQQEPAQWREVTGFGDSLVYVTPAELAGLRRRIDDLLAEFDDRSTDPAARPPDSRGIGIIQLVLPYSGPPAPPARPDAPDAPDAPAQPAEMSPADPTAPLDPLAEPGPDRPGR